MKHSILLLGIFVSLVIGGCKSASVNPITGQSLGITFHNFPPNRPGEVYALWVEIPKSAAPQPVNPLHGLVISKLVSTFTMNDTGIVGFDTTGFSKRLGVNFSTMIRAEVSVEQIGNIGSAPAADYLVGNISGTYTVGTATLTGDDPLAFGSSLSSVSGIATLASSNRSASNYIGEVYLMNFASDSTTSAGLTNLASLPSGWQYGVWTIDSATTPPLKTFLGYVISPDSKDTKSLRDNYNYPGGLTLDSLQNAPWNLVNGISAVLLSLEPGFSSSDPAIPFPAPVLYGTIPAGLQKFTPFPLTNVVKSFPSIDMRIAR